VSNLRGAEQGIPRFGSDLPVAHLKHILAFDDVPKLILIVMEVEWYAYSAGGIVMVASQDAECAIRIFRRELATRQHRLVMKPIFTARDDDRFFGIHIHVFLLANCVVGVVF